MAKSNNLRDMIKKILIDKGMTQADFARLVGVSPQYMRNVLYRNNVKMSVLEEWLSAINVQIVAVNRETGEVCEWYEVIERHINELQGTNK